MTTAGELMKKWNSQDRQAPRFSSLTEAEEWVAQQACRGGDCEAEVEGDPPRWVPLPCPWHADADRIADVLFRWQQRTGRAR